MTVRGERTVGADIGVPEQRNRENQKATTIIATAAPFPYAQPTTSTIVIVIKIMTEEKFSLGLLIDNIPLTQVISSKFLGVYVDEHLTLN